MAPLERPPLRLAVETPREANGGVLGLRLDPAAVLVVVRVTGHLEDDLHALVGQPAHGGHELPVALPLDQRADEEDAQGRGRLGFPQPRRRVDRVRHDEHLAGGQQRLEAALEGRSDDDPACLPSACNPAERGGDGPGLRGDRAIESSSVEMEHEPPSQKAEGGQKRQVAHEADPVLADRVVRIEASRREPRAPRHLAEQPKRLQHGEALALGDGAADRHVHVAPGPDPRIGVATELPQERLGEYLHARRGRRERAEYREGAGHRGKRDRVSGILSGGADSVREPDRSRGESYVLRGDRRDLQSDRGVRRRRTAARAAGPGARACPRRAAAEPARPGCLRRLGQRLSAPARGGRDPENRGRLARDARDLRAGGPRPPRPSPTSRWGRSTSSSGRGRRSGI